ncbi:hypothetical protein BU17DRAFT_93224 [Hysterangium stoloniferum]|nr:hypothetical protein BU17DRAFT_93224 [Hysterangium stoloniferum]
MSGLTILHISALSDSKTVPLYAITYAITKWLREVDTLVNLKRLILTGIRLDPFWRSIWPSMPKINTLELNQTRCPDFDVSYIMAPLVGTLKVFRLSASFDKADSVDHVRMYLHFAAMAIDTFAGSLEELWLICPDVAWSESVEQTRQFEYWYRRDLGDVTFLKHLTISTYLIHDRLILNSPSGLETLILLTHDSEDPFGHYPWWYRMNLSHMEALKHLQISGLMLHRTLLYSPPPNLKSVALTVHDHDGEYLVRMPNMGELFELLSLRLTRLEIHVKGDTQEEGWRYLSERWMQWSTAFSRGNGNYPATLGHGVCQMTTELGVKFTLKLVRRGMFFGILFVAMGFITDLTVLVDLS